MAYIYVADSMGLSLVKFVQWAPTHFFCTRVRIGRSSSFKVDDFGTNRKRGCDFLLVINSNFGPILHRFCDLLAKNCLFFLLLSYSAPSLPMFPLEFCSEFNCEETRVMGLSYSEDRTIVAGVALAWYHLVTDRQTESIIANTALCIASYADAL